MSQQHESNHSAGVKNSYLRFSLHNEQYAMPLLLVKEVIAMPEVTTIPNAPKYFLGIMNLRGQIISILDLRSKLNIVDQFNSETTVIICNLNSYTLGVVVDTVDSVLNILDSEIKEKPQIHGGKSSDYIIGVINKEEQLILLIDMLSALDMNDREVLNKMNKNAS
ncbi:chemotaxis protein CheW [bacterium]|nr:chemotaxis protein CheW [bacterium]